MTDKKNEIIQEVYNNFYGSMQDTFKDAKKKDPSVTLQDVKKYFSENFNRQKQLRGYNSYVANKPNQEYQLDLFFINDSDDQEYSTGLYIFK